MQTFMEFYTYFPGPFTNIYRPLHRDVAFKELRYPSNDSAYDDKVSSAFRDVLMPIWSQLSHEHVVPILGVGTNENSVLMLEVPYYKHGNIIEHNRRFPDANKLLQIKQSAAGIRYLHDMNVEHGNICPENFLVKDDGGICISDPGFNNVMRQLTYPQHKPTPSTWRYKPREELLHGTPMGRKADVYAWAAVVYEVFSGKQPYHGYHCGGGIVKIVNDGHRALGRPLEIWPELWNTIQKCWMPNAEERPTMDQVEAELRGL